MVPRDKHRSTFSLCKRPTPSQRPFGGHFVLMVHVRPLSKRVGRAQTAAVATLSSPPTKNNGNQSREPSVRATPTTPAQLTTPQQDGSSDAPSKEVSNDAEDSERAAIGGGSLGGVTRECQRGEADGLPRALSNGHSDPTAGMWDELGGHPRAMVEFEMELVHNNRDRLLQTLENALNQLELHGANATRLIRRSLALQQQQAQIQVGEGGHASVPHLQVAEDQNERRQQQHSALQREILETLTSESELWKTLEGASRQLDREAPLLGGFPIRLVKGPRNTLLPADYVMPKLLLPPGQAQQSLGSAAPDASRHAELSSLPLVAPVATGSECHATTPVGETPNTEAAGALTNESAAQTSAAAPAALLTEPVEIGATTRRTAASSQAALANMEEAVLAGHAGASDPLALSTQSGNASAVQRTTPTAARVAAARATAELKAARVDRVDNGASTISPAAATRHGSAASTATDDFAIRRFPGPIIVQNPFVHSLPCRRLRQRRPLPLEALDEDDECQGPAVSRPGYTVILLPPWMQRQPPDLAHSLQVQQEQLQQRHLGQQDASQQERAQEQERQHQELLTGQVDAMRFREEMLQRRNAAGAILDFRNELERQQGSLSAEYSTTNPSSLHSMLSVSPRSGSTNTESPPTVNPGRSSTDGES
ncbi:hypothetical protein ACSSS7_000669 [Eimeria intestinalis]